MARQNKTTVKARLEILDNLIDQYEERVEWQRADGNVVATQYYRGMVDALRRVRDGDFS